MSKLTRDEIRELVESGRITFDQFTDNTDMVFCIIKERYTDTSVLSGTNIIVLKDIEGNFHQPDDEEVEKLTNLIYNAHKGVSSVEDLLKFMISKGTNRTIMSMFIQLMQVNSELSHKNSSLIHTLESVLDGSMMTEDDDQEDSQESENDQNQKITIQ